MTFELLVPIKRCFSIMKSSSDSATSSQDKIVKKFKLISFVLCSSHDTAALHIHAVVQGYRNKSMHHHKVDWNIYTPKSYNSSGVAVDLHNRPQCKPCSLFPVRIHILSEYGLAIPQSHTTVQTSPQYREERAKNDNRNIAFRIPQK